MKPRYFCTLFNSGYLLKGLVMLESLARHCPKAHVFVLCMDEKTLEILSRLELPFTTLILLSDIEDDELLAVKQDRSFAEYCWTLSSWFTWHVLAGNDSIDQITYLDADLLFYASVEPVFAEIGDSSIAIIEHRFTPRLKDWAVNGVFCVEWVSFRRDDEGMACLSRWREQCLEWCYYRLEDGRMGDQKYLDEWPERFRSCHIIMHPGAGVAPWNYAQYKFDRDSEGNITVEGEPLIFYHFHQFQLLENGGFSRLSTFYTSECAEPDSVYETYESELSKALIKVQQLDAGFSDGLQPVAGSNLWQRLKGYIPYRIKDSMRRFVR